MTGTPTPRAGQLTRRALLAAAAAAAAGCVAGCGSGGGSTAAGTPGTAAPGGGSGTPDPTRADRGGRGRRLVVTTGGTKGVYWAFGQALDRAARALGAPLSLDVVSSDGSVENLQRLADGSAQVGFSAADAAADALRGAEPFPTELSLTALARVYDDYVHLVVPAGSPIRDLTDLAGRRVGVGAVASGAEVIAERLLDLAGLSAPHALRRVWLGINESVEALRAGRVDAFFWSGGLPTAGVQELAQAQPIRLVPLEAWAERMRAAHEGVYRPAIIPAGTYGLSEPVETIAVANLLMASADLPRATAEQFVRLLFDARPTVARDVPSAYGLDTRTAIFTAPVPLHAGALDFYRAEKP